MLLLHNATPNTGNRKLQISNSHGSYGETLLEQQNATGYYSPYTFSAKEKDEETGYSYFGARYYSAELSVWLGVDPMSDQAPGWTPYRYGFQNPVKFIDPDGMFEDEASARAYAKENGIKTGWFRQNQIVKHEDGTYSIDNRKSQTTTFQDKSLSTDSNKEGIYTTSNTTASKLNRGEAGPGALLLSATLTTLKLDLIPDPSDALVQKWLLYAGAIAVSGVLIVTMDQYLVYSKGGKQYIYDDEISPLSEQQLMEREQEARANRDTQLLKRINTEQKRRGIRNKQKRQN